MESQPLDFASHAGRAGFRLHRMAVYNWGTFHDRVWCIDPNGDNSLLTGDIGSGKSTLVDALTTLLVPAQRITYNKAAGAEARERSLRSYVLGYYKSERGETDGGNRPVSLRDHNSYSVILARFHHEGFDLSVTLAQVFYFRERQGQPERFYVVADRPLAITEDFAGFGSDLNALRKRLRETPGVEVFDTFPPYSGAFRRRFGISSEQALMLFSQTVSMKSVGNLTDFVRQHMLEAFPIDERIRALIEHFDDLNRAYEAVRTARQQIEQLAPLMADADDHANVTDEVEALKACREALHPWFASLKGGLLDSRLGHLAQAIARAEHSLETLGTQRSEQRARRDELRQAISDNGGDRLERLKTEIAGKRAERDERQTYAREYRALAYRLDLPDAEDSGTFTANRQALDSVLSAVESDAAQVQEAITEASVKRRQLADEHAAIASELESLRARRSNLPAAILSIRDRLCEGLGLDADEVPFVGELIQVRDAERDWEGAIERVLHPFGLSLLVPDQRYPAVADWVERTHLRGRLVYYRVRDAASSGHADLRPDSLVHKLAIQPESRFYAWLEQALARRFDYACCTELQAFRRETHALTRAGQIKAGGERHEKDDRHRIDDRTRFILGWSNQNKIEALEHTAGALSQRMQSLDEQIEAHRREAQALQARRDSIQALARFTDFGQIDWQPLATAIERLEAEYETLQAQSDRLRILREQFDALEQTITETDAAIDAANREHSAIEQKREQAETLKADCETLLAATPETAQTTYFPELAAMRDEALGEHTLTVESCDNRERDMRDWLQQRIDAREARVRTLRDRIVGGMRDFNNAWPLETREVDASIEAVAEYRTMLTQRQADDLPRFEARFKALLNENTINEIAALQSELNRQSEMIRERIETINRSLHTIEYNPGRYIKLLAEPAIDADIREFRQSLRACTEGAMTGSEDEQYSEAKFLQVKAIIERFRGREGTSEADQRWTRKVTDVRNAFVFAASERWREDDSEAEHYADSGGKSGGQKEKLAYTVLAASLAYQFGLEWHAERSRSFRFVVIDEAFGRGSDESARYGLALFQRLNLQLLIVTPMQKLHIIEPFVASVSFVHANERHESVLRNLTIEAFRAERDARRSRS
ncbi:ATP-dependent exonuclease SbcCD, C subunit-like protein [Spiribacter aquaticus]|uniref:ATP-dependent exonuclease SbcCD, C subunit-like protein n=1 Tax=Spiribacter aquaticus TaxID=1935996 RepID=A0A557RM52_9GAMM|nr:MULTISPECIES: ATP-binding protein [Spiribacter]KAF0279284.1 ATP-dependent exonuclease SbcCD, C subunit-like protein [Spiribacter roseus]TVO66243.1 ATP-dependent exonuclease SbcCD, C subunit-like protein [Spiribacter aquaticus]